MYELRVLTGLHRGAALPLIGQQWSLGNEEDADLVLFDPGIKPNHCRLIQLEDGWGVEGEQGKITDAEGHTSDSIEHLPVNTSFALNGVWMTIVDANTPWPQDEEEKEAATATSSTATSSSTASSTTAMQKAIQKPKSKSYVHFVLGFLSASAIVATSTWASFSPSAAVEPAVESQTEEVQTSLLPQLSTVAEVRSQLYQMLRQRELDNMVEILSSNDQVSIKGAINDMDRARVQRMLNLFQRQFHTSIKVTNKTTELSTSLPFQIVQITSGSMGSVITSTGKRLFIGDELDGVRLISVSENKITFKGKQDYEVNW